MKQVEQSLLDQLRAAGADIEAFRGLISDYVAMYRVCELLKRDIRKNGAMIEAVGSTGQKPCHQGIPGHVQVHAGNPETARTEH